ncbi:MAG: response regulator [Lachnospiraceae bacterium]|nr:response regulator [Lachnospiraceae bacterium]
MGKGDSVNKVLLENEKRANLFAGNLIVALTVVMAIIEIYMVSNTEGAFVSQFLKILNISAVLFRILTFILIRVKKGVGAELKYIIMICLLYSAFASSISNMDVQYIFIVIPILYSIRYSIGRYTVLCGALGLITAAFSQIFALKHYSDVGFFDVNLIGLTQDVDVHIEKGMYGIVNAIMSVGNFDNDVLLLKVFFKNLNPVFFLVIIIGVCAMIAKYNRNVLVAKLKLDEEKQLQEGVQHALNYVMTLAGDYEYIFNVELESGRYESYSGNNPADIRNDNVSNGFESKFIGDDFYEDIPKEIEKYVSDDHAPEILKLLNKEYISGILKKNKDLVYEYKAIINGEIRWHQLTVMNLPNQEGHVLVGVKDVHEAHVTQNAMQEVLKEAKEQAESANEAKTTFLFNMSHDIRTPLTAINGFTVMAKKYIDEPEKCMDCLNKIEKSQAQLQLLINQVLEMSRIESGKVILDEKPFNLTEGFHDVFAVLNESAVEHGVSIKFQDNSRQTRVLADIARMNQLALNIIGNAIKYTPSGGSISCTTNQLDYRREGYGLYRFIVKDNGIGMSREFKEKIFEPFSREQNSTASNIQGTGLGMSIVKKIVDVMGGTIEIESEEMVGTSVIVTLPLKIDQNSKALNEDDNRSAKKAVSLEGKRALVVEDNELNLEIAKDFLEEHDIIVESANDGSLAVSMVENSEHGYYDFVLMDIQMPGTDGYEATKMIRTLADKELANIPIIAMTANAFDEDKKKAREVGMNDHLSKPIEFDLLLDTVAKYL